MHIPMSRTEIANFLEQTPDDVERAWSSNALQRTVYHEERLSHDLAQSSIFDVLEYALAHGTFPMQLSKEHTSLWILYLCEAAAWEDWADWSVSERAAQLFSFAISEGLCDGREENAKVALTLVVAQIGLLSTCLQNDEREIHAA